MVPKYAIETTNPTIIYDALCLAKEVGMGRQPQRFSELRIVSNPLHTANHTSCFEAFHSHTYFDLFEINKEAAEQFNSLLDLYRVVSDTQL